MTFCHPLESFSKVAQRLRGKDPDRQHSPHCLFLSGTCPLHASEGPFPAVHDFPREPPWSPVVLRRFLLFFHYPQPSATTRCHLLPSPTRICLNVWSLSYLLMTALLEIQEPGRMAFLLSLLVIFSSARHIGMEDEYRLHLQSHLVTSSR